ncbi:MAG: hypothetical protein K1X44_07170 [Alphaproteobacteria bacterium]|nr:hypothetical protein [Alphaproteobacteria bacterium]
MVIFDLDGTLANIEHRIHFIQGKKRKWRDFFAACIDDKPHEAVITILQALYPLFKIYIVSGRSDEVRKQTEDWLRLNHVPYHHLIMRKEGDHIPDTILKISWVHQGLIPKDHILCVFDDRNKVVKMWRDAGITCFQVVEGDF